MKIFFSAGEPSGDQHAAHLIGELRRLRPDVECTGYGGPLMERAGCRLDHRLTDLAVMGFLRVVPLLRTFYRLVRQAGRRFAESPPDAVVLVDFPGFNWWIARKAKAAGIPVFYYLPPQLWAWAGWRVKRVRRYVDHVLCGLPFEPDWYAKRGVRAEYVGHPFFDEVADSPLDAEFVRQWSPTGHVGGACRVGCAHQGETPSHGSDGGHSPLDSSQRTIGILPGSRRHEVEHNWPTMVEVMRRLALRHPDVRFLVACYKPEFERRCRELLANCRAECHAVLPSGGGSGTPTDAGRSGTPSCEPGTLPVHFFVGRTPEIIEAAECCLMVSGSVSLEMLARETPAAVLYHVAPALYPLLRLLVHVDSITLPNLIAGRRVLPEWVVALSRRRAIDECTATLDRWLSDSSELARVRNELASLRNEFGRVGATVRTAEYILNHSPVARLRRAA